MCSLLLSIVSAGWSD
ncbi:hypothetical protein [Escherichia coli]|nr:hypothetical protein [Escherichia coli]